MTDDDHGQPGHVRVLTGPDTRPHPGQDGTQHQPASQHGQVGVLELVLALSLVVVMLPLLSIPPVVAGWTVQTAGKELEERVQNSLDERGLPQGEYVTVDEAWTLEDDRTGEDVEYGPESLTVFFAEGTLLRPEWNQVAEVVWLEAPVAFEYLLIFDGDQFFEVYERAELQEWHGPRPKELDARTTQQLFDDSVWTIIRAGAKTFLWTLPISLLLAVSTGLAAQWARRRRTPPVSTRK